MPPLDSGLDPQTLAPALSQMEREKAVYASPGFRPRIGVPGMPSIGGNDEFGGGNHSSGIGVRDMRSYQDWRRSCLPPPLWIPAFAGITRWVAGITGLAGATETHERDGKHSSRIGVRDMPSYQSPMPAGAGTPRYEN